MKTIWKYELKIADRVVIDMPDGAEVVTVQVQRGLPHLWAAVDPDSPLVSRVFYVRGTGHYYVGKFDIYVGTFQIRNGDLVFHVFEGDS